MQSGEGTAVVLAAGEGSRLSPLTNTRPKPMLPVANQPLLEHILEALVAAGIEKIVFVVGYQAERIRNHFKDGVDWNVDIQYVEQSKQLGTGHALLQSENAVDGDFLVLNGDRIIEPSIIETMAATATPAMAITQVADPSQYGVVTAQKKRLQTIEERPHDPEPAAPINAGIYHVDQSMFDHIRATDTAAGELPLTATLANLSETVRIERYEGTWLDVTYLWDLITANTAWVSAESQDGNYTRGDESTIAPDVAIASGTSIGPNATIGGGTAIGENVRIGPNVVLENAVVLSDATIMAGATLRDVIVGRDAVIRASVTVEGGPANVPLGNRIHEQVSLGAAVGDHAELGGGTVCAPGTIVGNNVTIATGSVIEGTILPGTRVLRG